MATSRKAGDPASVGQPTNLRPVPVVRPTRGRAALKVPHLAPADREALGKAARRRVPRSSHAELSLPPDRPDPVGLLEEQALTRVPELVPVRYGRMVSSPFAFYRGAARVMAWDLAHTPDSGIRAQACGDAHLSNFGVFGSAERRLVFDLNDFDETLPGPWEWDVKRLAASLVVAARGNEFTQADGRNAVLAAVGQYRKSMAQFAAMGNLEVWYASIDVEAAVADLGRYADAGRLRRTEKMLAKAKTRDHLQAFSKLVRIVDGRPRFVSDPPLLVPVEELASSDQVTAVQESVRRALRTYRSSLTTDRRHLLESFQYLDMAHKVVGVGSVGTRAWVILLMGRDQQDPLLLQVKEAQPSVLEEFVGRSEYSNSGHRVVAGQRLMQASSDIFLGWQHVDAGIDGRARDFYVRQLRDWKGSVEIEQMVPAGLALYSRLCGWTLARAHARTGDRIAIASYVGTGDVFDRALVEFAEAYADQNEKDHAELVRAVDEGRVPAVIGV
jgi:uncharacterized protein (DUF2252 family)